MAIDVQDNGDDSATLTFSAPDSGTAPQTGVYATGSDFAGFYPQATAPANIDAQLRLASRLVRRDTVTAVYTVQDDAVTPADPGVLEAFTEATCAQVAAWVAAGIDPFASGLTKSGAVVGAKGLDGATISYDNSLATSAAAFGARKAMIEDLVPEAVMILQDALYGLSRPWIRG